MYKLYPLTLLVCVLTYASSVRCEQSAAEELPDNLPATLRVGVKEAPPFVIRREDGSWSGISIELWQAVATSLGTDYRLEAFDLPDLFEALEKETVQVAVGALTITEEREELVDFTHTFYVSSLGIAVPATARGSWFEILSQVFSSRHFLKILAGLTVALGIFGTLLWWFERDRNPEQFGSRPLSGLGAGFWWAAVTMTTVGYGDKYPKTGRGRAIALLWMFASIVLVSMFTGAIASLMTVGRLSSGVTGPEDLPRVRVATIADTASAEWLREKFIDFASVEDLTAGLEALQRGRADALVYDMPILRYFARHNAHRDIAVLPRKFALNQYGLAVAEGSPLREALNRAILTHMQKPEWNDTVYRYLGHEP